MLHLGHVRTFVLADVLARMARQRGADVLFAFEFDAFGLPTEIAAREQRITPADLVANAVVRMKDDIERLGISVDWSHVPVTSDPRYYRLTQWFFLRLLDHGLVYRARANLNYCPSCDTTLAHLQVVGGRCWRCDGPVRLRAQTQWFVRLTRHSAPLRDGIATLDRWGETVRRQLAGFIGEVPGYEVDLTVDLPEGPASCTAFVARESWPRRPAAVLVAPGHPAVSALLGGLHDDAAGLDAGRVAVRHRRRDATRRDHERTDIGLRARHSSWPSDLPVLVSSDLDPTFGTGMTVVGEDEAEEAGWEPSGPDIRETTYHRVQDWLVSRQRAWGTPVPVLHCATCGTVPVPEAALPLELDLDEEGRRRTSTRQCPACGGDAEPDADTLDCFFDVLWCLLACSSKLPADAGSLRAETAAWQPATWFHTGFDSVFYVHLHRFLGYVTHEWGLTADKEPIRRYHGHAMVTSSGRKMSKSAGNAVSAMELLDRYDADVLRVHLLWAGNPAQQIEMNDDPPLRAQRLLARIEALVSDNAPSRRSAVPTAVVTTRAARAVTASTARSAKRITGLLESYRHCAALDELNRLTTSLTRASAAMSRNADETFVQAFREGIVDLVQLLGPFAPHLAEELWERLAVSDTTLAAGGWPAIDARA